MMSALLAKPVNAKEDNLIELTADKTPVTNIELFVLKKGTLITKEYYNIDEFDDVTFTGIVAYNPLNKIDKQKGVVIDIVDSIRRGSGYLDFDEMVEISKVANYLTNLSAEWIKNKSTVYSETIYITRDNMKIGIYKSPSKAANYFKRMFGRGDSNPDPKFFIALPSSRSENSFYFDYEHISEFKDMIDKSIKLLSDK